MQTQLNQREAIPSKGAFTNTYPECVKRKIKTIHLDTTKKLIYVGATNCTVMQFHRNFAKFCKSPPSTDSAY